MAAPSPNLLPQQIERIVLGRLASGKLVLPAMPAVASRCLELLRGTDYQIRKLVQPIETEPLLAALIMRSANTAAHGQSVKNLEQAVLRLGEQPLKTLIMAYASRQLFQSNDRRIADAGRAVWEHSLAVAQLARDLSALTGNADSEACYLAGLLHDIGKPIVVAMLLEAERSLSHGSQPWITLEQWNHTVDTIHRTVGVALATEWKLPDEATAAIRDCSDYDGSNRTSAANIVRFANALAKREGFAAGPVDAADVDALLLVGRSLIGSDDAVVERLVAGLKERAAKGLVLG